MKVTKTISYVAKFAVEYFEHTEGGMDHGDYGNVCNELADAIQLLELAQIAIPGRPWIITVDVEKQA